MKYVYFCVNDGLTGVNYRTSSGGDLINVVTGKIYRAPHMFSDFIFHNRELIHEPTNVEILCYARGDLANAEALP